MDAAQIPWRPLGELLVEHGILAEAELEQALAEQEKSGRRLGEIILELGFASGPAVTRALAEQWGIEISTESGFGTGLWGEIERRHREQRESEIGERPPVEHRVIEFPSGVTRIVHASGEEPEPPPEPEASADEADGAPQKSDERIGELETALEEARKQIARLKTRLGERDRELEELRSAPAAPAAPTAETERPAEEPPPDEHVLFVSASEGYRLVPRTGPPPEVGGAVELDDGAFAVIKVSRSPLPGDARPCAYLVAAS